MTKHCVVIGAGMSGLMAATALQAAGVAVTVLDKGRGVGGRMASRRLGEGRADHGAQYFTCYSAEMRPYVDQWLAAGVIREWAQGFYDTDGGPHFNGVPRYVGAGGMTAVAKHLSADLTVQTSTKVTQIDFDSRYVVSTEGGQVFEGDWLLMTPPAPQTLALLATGNVKISAEISQALSQIAYNPCFALMLVLDRPSAVPEPGGVWPIGGEPFSWIADNAQKGVSTLPTLTLHTGPAFTNAFLNADRSDVAERLIAEAAPYIGDATIVSFQLHRWMYSIPTTLHPEKHILSQSPAPIAFAGDAFDGSRVEGAALSGLSAAEALLARFGH